MNYVRIIGFFLFFPFTLLPVLKNIPNFASIFSNGQISMILIADSGSTKTDWALFDLQGTSLARMKTVGINPFHQSESEIADVLATINVERTDAVFFYGSGVRPELKPVMKHLLASRFPQASSIEAESDLLGAARALCGREQGIACILGTGSNSCLYDGQQIVENTPPLGYVLGDEGSGAVLGRNFLNAIYKGTLPDSLREAFEREYELTVADVIRKVYREPLANRWMASLSVFIQKKIASYPELSDLVMRGFRDFIQRNILTYHRNDLPFSAIGSIAYYYRNELAHAASLEGLHLHRVEASPMEGLIRYHVESLKP